MAHLKLIDTNISRNKSITRENK